jgi:hypothetical protein
MAVARLRLCKKSLLGNVIARDNIGTVVSGVFYAVRAKAI